MIDDERVTEVEDRVLQLVRSYLDSRASRLLSVGLKPEVLDISRRGDAASAYESEAVVYFWDHDQVADAIEFHIYRQGKQAASIDEIDQWLNATLDDVIARQGAKRRSV